MLVINVVNRKCTPHLVEEVAVVWVSSMKSREVWILISWSSISYMLSIADITNWCLFKLCLRLDHLGKPAIDFGCLCRSATEECCLSISLSLSLSLCLCLSWIHIQIHTHTCLSFCIREYYFFFFFFFCKYMLPKLHLEFLTISVHYRMQIKIFTIKSIEITFRKVWRNEHHLVCWDLHFTL